MTHRNSATKIYRAWINQPSTSQPLHYIHGKRCIVHDEGDFTVDVWFTEGPTHSMRVLRACVYRIKLNAAE